MYMLVFRKTINTMSTLPFIGSIYPFWNEKFYIERKVHMNLRSVCWIFDTCAATFDMCGVDRDWKVSLRERRRREREKFGDFGRILSKMCDKFDPNVQLHFTSASLRNLFLTWHFSSFTSTSLWNLFFSKLSASLHFEIFSRKSAIFPASLSASLLHPPPPLVGLLIK